MDWDTHPCFKELPVWINVDKPHRSLRFLVPGSRLLLNVSLPDSCIMNNRLPPGYQTTLGEWVALTPQLRLLTSPLKEAGDFTEPESAGPMIRRDLIQMIRRHKGILHRWAEYHQRQFRQRLTQQRLGAFHLSILNGKTLQEGSNTLVFCKFLRSLGTNGTQPQAAKVLSPDQTSSWLTRIGTGCALLLVCWLGCQLWYNGARVLET